MLLVHGGKGLKTACGKLLCL